MLNIRLEHLSPFHVHFPSAEKRSDVIILGKKYMAQEQTRPAKQQNLFTPTINSLLQQILDYEKKIAAGEAQRAVAADAVPALEQRSKELVTSMMKTIDAAFPQWPAKAKEWGFAAKKETANILTPKTQKDRLAVMETYIAKEEKRPEEERFTIPALADVIDNYQTYRATIQARDAGQYDREANINACNALVRKLAQYLQLAAGVFVGQEYDLTISKDLQRWGFKVVERRRGRKAGSPETASAETNGSNGDNGLLDIDGDAGDLAG